jgi:hypothetical protein
MEPSQPVQGCNGIALPSSENSVLGMAFGSKRDKVTQEKRMLHNDELNDLYSSPKIIRVIK